MNEDFVPYELAVKLQEKGYPQKDIVRYDEQGILYICDYDSPVCAAPTIQQTLKWLRKTHKLHIEFVSTAYGYNIIISQTPEAGGTDYYFSHNNYDGPNDGGAWDEIDDAAVFGINYILDNLI